MNAFKIDLDGKGPAIGHITFTVTEPVLSLSQQVEVAGRLFWVSACVLPGMDAHGTVEKQCQDMCFFETDGRTLICGEFDGHGTNGRDVARFCSKSVKQLYQSSGDKLRENPLGFLETVTKKVDADLKLSDNGVDASGSGTTEVLLLLIDDTIYIAGVGDSRGILGSLDPPQEPPAIPRPLRGEEKANMDIIKNRRVVNVNSAVKSVQLTKDQKPEDPEELIRIFRCGGRVYRQEDELHNKIGPYRVWKPNTKGPGLAMSRSIGDTVGTDLGVISDPILTEYHVNWDSDLFMFCASDGVWDVMENEDVVRFIERYRYACVRGTGAGGGAGVNCGNATIAQMICEEARTRWYTILEKEEVTIDDISCVVVEFNDAQSDSPSPRKATRLTEDSSPSKDSRLK